MSDDFTIDEKARMIEHMNDDHSDACLLYATHYLGMSAAQAAMTGITRTEMTLDVEMDDGTTQAAVLAFERPLTSVEDAAMHLAQLAYAVSDAEDG